MTLPELLAAVQMRFPALTIHPRQVAHTAFWQLAPDDLVALGEFLRDQATPHFDLLLDINLVGDRLEYQLVSRSARQRLRLSVPAHPTPPSLAFIWPAAAWAESQIAARHGLAFAGHPRPGDPFAPTQTANTTTVWAGERMPTTVNGLRVDLEEQNEVVQRAMPRLGYRYCAIERRLCERPYDQGGALLARLDAAAPLHADLAYALAVEALLGVDVPPHAQRLRMIAAELSRIANHLRWLSNLPCPADTPARRYALYAEQTTRDLLRRISNHPLGCDWIVPGGLRGAPDDGLTHLLHDRHADLVRLVSAFEQALNEQVDLFRRLSGIGVLDPGTALGLGVTGPCLRASGIAYDVRRTFPYAGYAESEFEVPVMKNGDAEARLRIRMAEIRAALNLLGQLVSDLDKTDGQAVNAFAPGTLPAALPAGSVYVGVESPRGELGLYLIADGSPHLACAAVRGPSLANLSALPLITGGLLAAQVALVLDSLDISVGEAER